MNGEYTVSTDKKEKIKLDSRIISANWLSSYARGGAEAQLRVKTVFVAEGSSIEIKGRSSEGKSPDTIKGKVYSNEFVGKLLIPEKVKVGADIWFEAKLPKHGLKMESGTSIPARPPILAKKICWDRKEVKRDDEVLLTCQFESGITDGEEASIIVLEYNPNSYDFKTTSFQTTIENNKIEVKWLFTYQNDTMQIPTEEELKKSGKHYAPPQYYFVVVVDGVRIGEKRESGLLRFNDWIEIGMDGSDYAGRDYTLTLPDGSTRTGKLDDRGKLREVNMPPGPCSIKFKEPPDTNDDLSENSDDNSGSDGAVDDASEPTDSPTEEDATNAAHVVRLIGLTFDANKCFLLPYALPGIKAIVAMHKRFEKAEVLIVGHDGGDEELKGIDLACRRAEILGAYLTNDVDAWHRWFGSNKPTKIRWGTREVQLMLSSIPEGEAPFYLGSASGVTDVKTKESIKKFQTYCNCNLGGNLTVDGVAGPKTQKELLKAYMALEDTTLSADIVPTSHGCEGQFEDDLTLAGMQPDERIIEVFFFEKEISPVPKKKTSLNGATDYGEWKKLVVETKNYEYHGIHVQVIDKKKMPVKNAKVILDGPTKCESYTDDQGFVFFSGLVKGTYSVRAEKQGIEIPSSTITYPTAKTLSRKAPASKK